jgi:hypothetical protein
MDPRQWGVDATEIIMVELFVANLTNSPAMAVVGQAGSPGEQPKNLSKEIQLNTVFGGRLSSSGTVFRHQNRSDKFICEENRRRDGLLSESQ